MIHKPIDEITKDEIDALIENEVPEGRQIEYKREMPGNGRDAKKEFLADVSSFANAAGGDILLGIVAEDGVPKAAEGIPLDEPEKAVLRLDNMIRDGIAPRILGFRIVQIDGFPNGPVILIRIPESWAGPHMVKFGGTSRFHTRHSAGKYAMDVREIRAAFALSDALPERIRRFRDDRLGKIIAGNMPAPIDSENRTVLHVIPFSAFAAGAEVDLTQRGIGSQLRTIGGGGSYRRFNVDGLLTYSPPRPDTGAQGNYCQVFRSGIVEAVNTSLLRRHSEDRRLIPSAKFERDIVAATQSYLSLLSRLDVQPPALILLALTGVEGYRLSVPIIVDHMENTPVDRDMLLLPEVLIEDFECDVPKTLHPVFDALWNADGYRRSFNYDDDGNWNPEANR